jgi:hypothetical protein
MPGQGSREKTAGTGQQGQEIRDRIIGEKIREDRGIAQPGEQTKAERPERVIRKGQPG